jgi:hypothetical protein
LLEILKSGRTILDILENGKHRQWNKYDSFEHI